MFPLQAVGVAKQFWQHTGDGISSRLAERCLILLGAITCPTSDLDQVEGEMNSARGVKVRNRYYTKLGNSIPLFGSNMKDEKDLSTPTISTKSKGRYGTQRSKPLGGGGGAEEDPLSRSIDSISLVPDPEVPWDEEEVLSRYVEERYGRNLDISLALIAKLAMRRRIAGVLRESSIPGTPTLMKGEENNEGGEERESTRGVQGLSEKDVWLYPCGMSAIYHAHQLAIATRSFQGGIPTKSICFGYVTLPPPPPTFFPSFLGLN